MLKQYIAILFFIIFATGYLYSQAPNEIRYNGKLKEYGEVTNGTKTMKFKIYDQLTGGTAKWESNETQIQVTNGIFSYTFSPDETSVDWSKKDFYLEIVIEGKVLSPREKLTSVPYSLHSTSATHSINADNITSKTKGQDFSVNIGGTNFYMVPKGTIVMWYGSEIPDGWVLCDGDNGTPNLVGRFPLGAIKDDEKYGLEKSGGEETHTLTIAEMPSHSHNLDRTFTGGGGGLGGSDINTARTGIVPFSILETGGNQPHNNMPPFSTVVFIMRK